MKRRILSDEQIDEMAELRERGWSYGKIAKHFTARGTPVSDGSISWQCLRVGADLPAQMQRPVNLDLRAAVVARGDHLVRRFTDEDDRRLLEMDAAGESYTRIAVALGRKPNSIRGRL